MNYKMTCAKHLLTLRTQGCCCNCNNSSLCVTSQRTPSLPKRRRNPRPTIRPRRHGRSGRRLGLGRPGRVPSPAPGAAPTETPGPALRRRPGCWLRPAGVRNAGGQVTSPTGGHVTLLNLPVKFNLDDTGRAAAPPWHWPRHLGVPLAAAAALSRGTPAVPAWTIIKLPGPGLAGGSRCRPAPAPGTLTRRRGSALSLSATGSHGGVLVKLVPGVTCQ